MVQETNFIYLAIIICMHYLGFQHDSYQLSIEIENSSKDQAARVATLDRVKDKANEWLVTAPHEDKNIYLYVEKTKLTDREKVPPVVANFDDINFKRFTVKTDTLFNNKNEALILVSKNSDGVRFKILKDVPFNAINLKFNKK